MKYLFYLAKRYSISIVQPLVELLQAEDRDYAFYVSERVYHRLPAYLKQKPIFRALKDAINYQPDYVIVPGNFVDHRIPGVKVQIFHGLGVEKASHYKIRHFFDVYLTSGPYVTQRYEQMRPKKPYFEVIETGWLKIDAILSAPEQDLRQHYHIPEGKKVILYAPTFSSKMESSSQLIHVIPSIIAEDEFWLFKFHALMPNELILPFLSLSPDQALIVQEDDITPALHLADLMISDTSSVVYEFFALDKPVITFNAIGYRDKTLNISRADQLRAAIDRSLQAPDEFATQRHQAMQAVNPYLDGDIARRTLAALDSLDPKSFPRKGKPLNLFRKAQVLWHSITKKGYLR